MTEIDYAPMAQVPALDKLRTDIKKAALEHPEYGTCPNCIKAVRVDKLGRLSNHVTPELARGSLKASYRCPGSGLTYAEHGDFGQTWNVRTGNWMDLDVELAVLFVDHPDAASRDVELPLWQLAGVPASELARRSAKKLLDGSMWRIELVYTRQDVTGHLIRVDWEGGPRVWDSQTESQVGGGIRMVLNQLIARLESSDLGEAAIRNA